MSFLSFSNFTYPALITGFMNDQGALSVCNSFAYTSHTMPSAEFLSYCVKDVKKNMYFLDENYGETGSSFYQIGADKEEIRVLQKISNREVKGGVFILEHADSFFIPGFHSQNIWMIDKQFRSVGTVRTCPNPHGIYFYNDVFYVPCRGALENNDANYIYRYMNNDLSVSLPDINLSGIQPNMGPRHLVFLERFMYVVTEYACEILKIDTDDLSLVKRVKMTDAITPEMTGGEIRTINDLIFSTLRKKDQPGELIRHDKDLNETGRLIVGKNPRFFNFDDSGFFIIVLNQDDQSFTVIDLEQWKIVDTVGLEISPQCFI